MKKMKHTVSINIADQDGNKQKVLQSKTMKLPQKIVRWLFGEFCEVLVLTPGQTVAGIEIKEIN